MILIAVCAMILGGIIAVNIWYWSLPAHERALDDDDLAL